MKRLRVLVLIHEELVPPESIEGLSDAEINPFKMEYDVLTALRDLGHTVTPLGVADELAPIRRAIAETKPQIVFNLLNHFHGVASYEAHVVSYLELLKIPYTGCNPRGLTLAGDKALSKKILAFHRIPVPTFRVYRMGHVVRAPRGLEFPMIAKSVNEHASVGIAQKSIVHDEAQLRERVEFVHRTVGTDAIVERYIDGREIYVGVMGNERLKVLPIWELTFRNLPDSAEPIATSKVKWDLQYQKKVGVRTGPAESLSEDVRSRIERVSRRVFRALNLTGYARLDFRLDAEGRPWVLEANPNPDLCFGEDFAESAEHSGIEYTKLVQRLLQLGLRYAPAWKQD